MSESTRVDQKDEPTVLSIETLARQLYLDSVTDAQGNTWTRQPWCALDPETRKDMRCEAFKLFVENREQRTGGYK